MGQRGPTTLPDILNGMYQHVDDPTSIWANRAWWDQHALSYQQEYADRLGVSHFSWGPEGLTEAEAALLGPVKDKTVAELGCGAAQCTRWLTEQGARAVGIDLSLSQLQQSAAFDEKFRTPTVAAHAGRLPLANGSLDLAFSAYGVVQFVSDLHTLFLEIARVLIPGGRWVFSVTHPIRWAFPDDPGPAGLTATRSYFDRRAYAEHDDSGEVNYVEHHRTLGDYVSTLTDCGFLLTNLTEPTWPDADRPTWGGWSALRGQLLPGTAIFTGQLPS